MDDSRLVVFAREPRLGEGKTRLGGLFTPEERLELSRAFCRDTVELARRVRCGVRVLAYDGGGSSPRFLKAIAGDFIFERQRGKDLGQRLSALIKPRPTVIIGSDAPDLPSRLIEEAFRRLKAVDVVFGPARDGGFYLVGLKKSCPFLWRGVKWGTSDALVMVRRNAERRGLKAAMLPRWEDVDDAVSLGRLRRRLKRCRAAAPATRRFLLDLQCAHYLSEAQ